ncbi:bifunctional diguanylate cyclase/phosphodiesterase [Marinobacterium jannaschii]|uniref:bifunctional diguanylate cyclase/phosphodiesterase n=1 Tax=Marinobacterium jannaschii TaxID=64970 RepID=UPI000687F8E0|nr:EAL domain-containing protein [Marinobacterium jannaschii]
MFSSLRSRLIKLLVLVALPGVGVISFQTWEERNTALEGSRQAAIEVTRQVALSQKKIIDDTRYYLAHLAQAEPLQNPASAECRQFLRQVLRLNSSYINIGVPLPDGNLLCNALPLNKPVNVADRGYFQKSLTQHSFAIGNFQYDRAAGVTSVNFSYPVTEYNSDRITGIAVAVVSLDWWSQQLKSFKLPAAATAVISDSDGKVIARYPQQSDLLGRSETETGLPALQTLSEDLTPEIIQGSDGITRAYTRVTLFTNAEGRSICMMVGIPFDEALASANRNFAYSLLSFLAAMLLVTLFALRELRQSILLPLRKLTLATQSLLDGQLVPPASGDSPAELALLMERFKEMAETRLEAEHQALRRSSELDSVFKALPDLYFRLCPSGKVLDCKGDSASNHRLELLAGQNVTRIMPPDMAERLEALLHNHQRTGETIHWEYPLPADNGKTIFEARINAIQNSSELVLVVRDITDRRSAENLIWQQAHYDNLTGLPNRAMLQHQMQYEMALSDRTGLPFAILFLDLDRFKEINDTLGHDMGDLLLKQTARRLQRCTREQDLVARQGGDEFTLILSQLIHADEVKAISQRILKSLEEPFRLGEDIGYITASIGISLYPTDGETAEELFKSSDQAMYAAKSLGKNCYHFFTPAMQQAVLNRMHLIRDMRNAQQENQFKLYCQPIICLDNGSICKGEALIRWQHPERGIVSPAEFIPLAEDTHKIIEIGDWVFYQALEALPALRTRFGDNFQISINVSPVQFATGNSGMKDWPAELDSRGLPGNSLVAEITEGLIVDPCEETSHRLIDLARANIQVAMDDFGTGYSSLAYLRQFDIDFLKIDRSFVKNLETDPEAFLLCEAIIAMAHKLGIKVIAEGIETGQQRDLLTRAGCDYGQGYLFSPAIPIETFAELPLFDETIASRHAAMLT